MSSKVIYDKKALRDLPSEKPRLCWFPKYRTKLLVADAILTASDPFAALEEQMTGMGFELDREHRHAAVFTRGESWGDFSAKVAQVNVKFAMPLQKEAELQIEYGHFALFDTGDLWHSATQLKEQIQK